MYLLVIMTCSENTKLDTKAYPIAVRLINANKLRYSLLERI